jgi:hypothetical protein
VLSSDGKRLYFASNRPGGHGGLDFYYSERRGEQWSAPVNLGPSVNTAENDVDLAISRDAKTLIFPAKRPDSIAGSTDLYVSPLRKRRLVGGEESRTAHQYAGHRHLPLARL